MGWFSDFFSGGSSTPASNSSTGLPTYEAPTIESIVESITSTPSYGGGGDSDNSSYTTPVAPPPSLVAQVLAPDDAVQAAIDSLPSYDPQPIEDIVSTIIGDSNGGDSNVTPVAPTPVPVDPYAGYSDAYRQYAQSMNEQGITNLAGDSGAVDLLSSLGGDVTSSAVVDPFVNQYSTFRDTVGDTFDQSNLMQLGDYATGDFAGGDFTGQLVYNVKDDIPAQLSNILTPTVMAATGGSTVGTVLNKAGVAPQITGQVATLADQAINGWFNRNKIADTVQLADGTVGYVTNFAGKTGFTTKEAMTQRNIEAAQQMQDQSGGDSDAPTGADIASAIGTSTQMGSSAPSWRDYYNGSTLNPVDVAKNMVTGNLKASELKSVQLAGRIAAGEDLVTATMGVYGEGIRELLPEGYEKPTEAALRIAAGEDRVTALGSVYGEDFNLDNPMGKAGLKGASVYDQTGDGQQALEKSVYTYFKEGGKLPDFEIPNFLPEVDANVNADWLKGAGFNIGEVTKFLPKVSFGALKGAFGDFDLKSPDIDIPNIDFTGVKPSDLGGYTLPELKDMGVDIPSLDIGADVDLGGLQGGLEYIAGGGGQGVLLESDEEFQSLDSPFELSQDDESLARDLLAGRI